MKKNQRYNLAILILSVIIILQGIFIIISAVKKAPPKIAKIPVVEKNKIAIVLDDWGYNLNNIDALSRIKYPLTLAVLPNLNYSQLIAEKAHNLGFELILHLPLEPREKLPLEKDTITTDMDSARISDILRRDLKNIPYLKGASNHMGSKATADTKTMESIFKELNEQGLYYLDSFVTSQSVCAGLAAKMRLRFARRDIFLDNSEEAAYIKGQIYKLKTRARAYGKAIGIGHDRRVTLEALKEIMPKLEKEGYRFVFVSELAR